MKWTALEPGLFSSVIGDDPTRLCFMVTQLSRCWVATWTLANSPRSEKIGDYRTERLAKAACRRKAGRIVDSLKRAIRA